MEIRLLGTSFRIQSDEDADYLESVLQYLEKKIEDIETTLPVKEPLKISILSSIFIIDELFKERELSEKSNKQTFSNTAEDEEIERIALRIIDRIDKSLAE